MKASKSNILLLGSGALALLLLADLQAAGKLTSNNTPTQSQTTSTGTFKGNADFVKKLYPYALAAQKATGIPAAVILSFAAIESAWGKKAPKNNFFGIKAGSQWKGETQLLKTFECGKTGNAKTDRIKDQIISVHAPNSQGAHAACSKKGYYTYRVYGKFRAYPTVSDGFIGFGQFIRANSRYKNALNYLNNPAQCGLEILKASYATAPSYKELYIKILGFIYKNMPV